MATVTLEQVRKVYPNRFEAVNGIDLHVADGEFMVLVGPSGCGKTTLLRMVAGLEDITAGTIRIGNRVVNDLGPRERDIAMVFQSYALYPHMTVAKNIGFTLKLRKLPKGDVDARVSEAARVLGLTEWVDRRPRQLSGGQRQRVAMGRAIVREPSVFLMDEPLSNLDANLRVQMRAEVKRIQQRLGVASLYVTHDQVEALTMGDRVAVMRGGLVQQCDSPQVVYDRPANLFVAAFIGSPSMNLYQATIGEGARSMALGAQQIALPEQITAARPALRSYTGKKVVIGLRPEHLPVAAPETLAVIEGDVNVVEALGSQLLVHFSIDAQKVTSEGVSAEEEQFAAGGAGVACVDVRTPLRPGERGRFAVDVDRIQFFDAQTHQAVWD